MSNMDPIHYVSVAEENDWEGKVSVGWWFWDETWADRYGPYATREQAEDALERYAKQL